MTRVIYAWRELRPEQRLAGLAALGLFVSMLLPWYSETSTLVEHDAAKAGQSSLSAFQAFSFVEAAVLVVCAGVLVMLFARGEERDFKLPGGDGLIVTLAGSWTALLIFYRLLDKPGLHGNQRFTSTVGVEWGIFIALLLAIGLAYSGSRMRAAERHGPARVRGGGPTPEPPPASGTDAAPDWPEPTERLGRRARAPQAQTAAARAAPARSNARETGTPAGMPPDGGETGAGTAPVAARARSPYPPAPDGQMSFEDPPPQSD
jgi:hypothetical protein